VTGAAPQSPPNPAPPSPPHRPPPRGRPAPPPRRDVFRLGNHVSFFSGLWWNNYVLKGCRPHTAEPFGKGEVKPPVLRIIACSCQPSVHCTENTSNWQCCGLWPFVPDFKHWIVLHFVRDELLHPEFPRKKHVSRIRNEKHKNRPSWTTASAHRFCSKLKQIHRFTYNI
jgi:hypothetical protein